MALSAQQFGSLATAPHHVVAYSGGLDSTVLLHLAQAAGFPGLQAVHVHHGLQDSADDWVRHCEAQCMQWQIPLTTLHVTVDPLAPQGPEAAARAARYAALQQAMPPNACLLTAHHQRDQAETVLLRLLRGTGVDGVAAMEEKVPFGPDGQWHWRPLLTVAYAELRQYAQRHQLHWVEDPHNRNSRYARSWLRHEVMPQIYARWPDADVQFSRAARHADDARELLAGQARRLIQVAMRPDQGLSVSRLLQFTGPERRLVLRHWLNLLQLPLAFASTWEQVENHLLTARADAEPLVCWPGGEFRRYRDALYAMPAMPSLQPAYSVQWSGEHSLALPQGFGWLHAPEGLTCALQVRFARGGERLKPVGHAHTRSLKQLAQSEGLPPWLRSRLPLLFEAGSMVSVAGRWNANDHINVQWQAPAWAGLPLSWLQ